MLAIAAANLGSDAADVRVFLRGTNSSLGTQEATLRPASFDENNVLIDIVGLLDDHAGPLFATVTVQSVKAVEQTVATVHRGSSDISWGSAQRDRVVSSAASTLDLNATFTLSTNDRVALSSSHTNCSFAPTAPFLSDGSMVQRAVSSTDQITLPTGSGGDVALAEGDYTICVCDNDEGSTVMLGTLIAGGCNTEAEFTKLPQQLQVIAIPKLGFVDETTDLRVVSLSSPTYPIWATGVKGFSVGDVVFASARNDDCGSIPGANSFNETSLLYTTSADAATLTATFGLPSDVQLEALSTSTARTLSLCFTTRESGSVAHDFVKLSSSLHVIPEPTDALETTTWFEGNVFQLSFNQPAGAAGITGDIVVLDPVLEAMNPSNSSNQSNCSTAYTRNLAGPFPLRSSAKFALQSDGVAREYAIAQGKLDELPAGTYRVCYATKTSLGDAQSDFRMLTKTVEFRPAPSTHPRLEVSDTVALGSDIVVKWTASNGLDGAVAAAGSWLGLYEKGSCLAYNVNIHKCHIAARNLPANTTSGEVRFSQSEYKEGGDFDVRYFSGDTRHGQGMVCRGLKRIQETYLQCALEVEAVSGGVFVDAEEATPLGADMPGLEATFEGGEEVFEVDSTASII